ncbi:MAG: SDR family oxidoreductase [Solirubrobacteraceae bacterium]
MSSLDLAARVVLVTGGTRGIGASIATRFLEEGAAVTVCGRSAPQVLPRAGSSEARFVQADVRDPDQAPMLVQAVTERYGRLDVLVNNAGGTSMGAAATMPPAVASSVVSLNLLAPFYVAQLANAVMQEQPDGGTIINVGSVAAIRPAPGTALYAAAKAGVLCLTRALALEWGPKVRVNQVTPGLVETGGSARHYGGASGLAAVRETIPGGRMARPRDVADATLLLASPLARYVSGAELRVDGGGEVPGWLVAIARAGDAGDS